MTIQELEEWFADRELPAGPIQISKSTTIHDLKKCVETEFLVIKNSGSAKMQEPRILGLMEIKEWLENQSEPSHGS